MRGSGGGGGLFRAGGFPHDDAPGLEAQPRAYGRFIISTGSEVCGGWTIFCRGPLRTCGTVDSFGSLPVACSVAF